MPCHSGLSLQVVEERKKRRLAEQEVIKFEGQLNDLLRQLDSEQVHPKHLTVQLYPCAELSNQIVRTDAVDLRIRRAAPNHVMLV